MSLYDFDWIDETGERFTIKFIGLMKNNFEPVVIYQSTGANNSARVWVCSVDEFFDGRFTDTRIK